MKKYVSLFLILFFLKGCLIIKIFDAYVKFTIDGEQYEWKSIISHASYDISDSSTYVVFTNIGAGQEIGFQFKGKSTGTYIGNAINSENWIVLIGFASGTYTTNAFAAACTIKITEYGAVGKYIKGNFSGRLVNAVDSTDYISLKNGNFEIERGADED